MSVNCVEKWCKWEVVEYVTGCHCGDLSSKMVVAINLLPLEMVVSTVGLYAQSACVMHSWKWVNSNSLCCRSYEGATVVYGFCSGPVAI
jgi:hypothetical protein